MSTPADLSKLSADLLLVARQFDQKGREEILWRLDKPLKADVAKAVRADAGGDLMLSGWPRATFDVDLGIKAGAMGVRPTPRSGGPMRVLESGRNQGNARGFSGPGINVKTGVTSRTKGGALRKVRARKGRRWNGYTRGKNTWTDATELMQSTVDELLPDFILDKVGEFLG